MSNYEGKTKSNKVLKIVAIILAVIIAAGAVWFFFLRDNKDEPDNEVTVTDSEKTTISDEVNETEPETELITGDESDNEAEEEFDRSVYDSVLELYRSAKADYAAGNDMEKYYESNLTNSDYAFANNLVFAYADVAGDSKEELIVGISSVDGGVSLVDGAIILNIWKVNEGKAEPMFADTSFGYKAYVMPCVSNTLLTTFHSGATDDVYNIYDTDDITSDPSFVKAICKTYAQTTETYSFYEFNRPLEGFDDFSDGIAITEEEYNEIYSSHIYLGGFEWNNL